MRKKASKSREQHLADHAENGSIVSADQEKAYRRGFSHGVAIALKLIALECNRNDLEEWLETALRQWRSEAADWIKGEPVKASSPPLPRRPAKKNKKR